MNRGSPYEELVSMSELEEAVLEQKPIIVIRDEKLGNRTVLWLSVGRILDGLSLVTAVGSIICSLQPIDGTMKYARHLAIGSLLMHLGYQLQWSPHGLIHYSVSQGPDLLSIIKGQKMPSTIIQRNLTCKRRFVYVVVSVVAAGMAFWRDFSSDTFNFREMLDKIKNIGKKELAQD